MDATGELKGLTGSKVIGVEIPRTDMVVLRLFDGRRATFSLSGDCCSRSEFTDPKQFDELAGAIIITAEDRCGQSNNNLPEPEGSDTTSWHFLVFTTNKGYVTVDWHNDSNGYYDGYLAVSIEP